MATYEYRCARCDELIEVYQSFSDAPLTKHSGCGGKLTKVLSPAGIVLKGSGFYKTDNRGKKSSGGGSSRSESSGSSSDASSGSTDSGGGASTAASGDAKKANEKSSTKKSGSTESKKP